MQRRRLGFIALALILAVPTSARAQLEVTGRGASVRIGGLVQPQYSMSSVDGADNDFMLRRARLRADATVNDFLGGRVLTEFGGGGGRILDAYVSMDFSEAFTAEIGQFKRAFDLFELPSPADLPEIEKDGRIEGFSPCPDIGSNCAYSRFTEQLGYAGRDIGVRVGGTVGQVTYLASVTNGPGLNTPDQNDAKSFSGRATIAVNEDLRIGGQLAIHDYVDPDGNANAFAFGGDVELGTFRDGLHVRGALVAGDNWQNLGAGFDPATFLTLQGIVTYFYPQDGDRLTGIEPLARLSYGDPDTDTDDDGGLLFTPGVMFYVMGRNRIGANLDIYSPQTGDKEFALQVQTTLYY
ncbi:MAG: porin [Gemmatimonadota bacterium]|jgi:hypothetical protein